MPTVRCTNPDCGMTVPLPDHSPAGLVYSCPGCAQALPPVPRTAPTTRDGGPASWQRLSEEIGQRERGSWLAALRADQRRRWGRGERVRAELYFEHFPVIADHAELAVGLIYSEALLRAERGERPTAQEDAARFPQHADQLPPQCPPV